MKTLIALLVPTLICLTTVPSALAGGDFVGNGGGLAEKNILFAYENVVRHSQLCLDSRLCRLNNAERDLLADILKAMPKEREASDQVRFASEKKKPGFFVIDREIKVAKTGSKIGSPIYINVDMIYAKNSFGEIQPMSVSSALAVLIHELGHHVSSASHETLDLLGVKVANFLQNQIQSTPLLPWSDQISATIIQSMALQTFPQILLNVGDEVLDLSQAFENSVFCPKITIPVLLLPFPDLQFGNERPDGTIFHNVHWDKSEREGLTGDFTIVGNLTHLCPAEASQTVAGVNSFQYRISFSTIEKNGRPQLRQETIQMSQTYEPWYKLIRVSH